MENRETVQKIEEPKGCFRKANNIDSRRQKAEIRNESRTTTAAWTEAAVILREHHQQLHTNKLENRDKMDTRLETQTIQTGVWEERNLNRPTYKKKNIESLITIFRALEKIDPWS